MKKPSTIFEGPESSLRKTAVNPCGCDNNQLDCTKCRNPSCKDLLHSCGKDKKTTVVVQRAWLEGLIMYAEKWDEYGSLENINLLIGYIEGAKVILRQ